MKEPTIKFNPDLIPEQRDDSPVFYNGDDYQVRGPMERPLQSMGILWANSDEVLNRLESGRSRLKQILEEANDNGINFMRVISSVSSNPPKLLVDLPPKNYVNLTELDSEVADKVYNKVKESAIYNDSLKPEDFWVDPETYGLFLMGLDKLSDEELKN